MRVGELLFQMFELSPGLYRHRDGNHQAGEKEDEHECEDR
jgi:hypothetical protein